MTTDNNDKETPGIGPETTRTNATTGTGTGADATQLNPWPATLMVIASATSIISSSFAIGWIGLIGGVIGLILAVIVAKTEKFHAWKPGEQLYGGALVMKLSWQKTVGGTALLAIMGLILGVMLVIAG